MSKLIIKDKEGIEREVTQKAFDLIGEKRGWKIIGKKETPKTEMEELKDKLRAEKAAGQLAKQELTTEPEINVEPKKRGPKPKTTEA